VTSSDDRRAYRVRFDGDGRPAFRTHGRTTQNVVARENGTDFGRRHWRSERDPRIPRDQAPDVTLDCSLGRRQDGTAELGDQRQLGGHQGHRARQVANSLYLIEATQVADPNRPARRTHVGSRLSRERLAETQTIEDELVATRSVRRHHVAGTRREDDEPVGGVKECALLTLIESDEVAHAETRADFAGHASRNRSEGRWKRRHRPSHRLGKASLLKHARRALYRPTNPVARDPTPPHQRSTLTKITQATRVSGHDDPGARLLRGRDLEKAEPRHERVEVHDVGLQLFENATETRSAPHRRPLLRLRACRRFRNRIPDDGQSLVLVPALVGGSGIGRDDPDVVSPLGKSPAEPGYVNFGSTRAFWKVPRDGLDDSHGALWTPPAASGPHPRRVGLRALRLLGG